MNLQVNSLTVAEGVSTAKMKRDFKAYTFRITKRVFLVGGPFTESALCNRIISILDKFDVVEVIEPNRDFQHFASVNVKH